MSLQEIESQVAELSSAELTAFMQWFQRFMARANLHVKESDDERTAWARFSAQGLERAYAETEPEYTTADIKAS